MDENVVSDAKLNMNVFKVQLLFINYDHSETLGRPQLDIWLMIVLVKSFCFKLRLTTNLQYMEACCKSLIR